MQLSARAVLSGMIHQSTESIGVLKSRLDLSQEVSEAVEALQNTQMTGKALLTMMDELELARRSLVSCGYSQKWLDTVNVDNSFVDVVNLDLVKLVGSKEEKTAAAMEGIWSTIWDYIKKIWDFIVGLFNKIVNFVKVLFGIAKSDLNETEKAVALLKGFHLLPDPEKAVNELGDAANKAGTGSGAIDMRQLVTRMNVCISLACHLCPLVIKSTGMHNPDKKTGDGFFDEDFADYAVAASDVSGRQKTGPRCNKIFKDFLYDIENQPANIVTSNPVRGFSGFSPTETVNLKDALRQSGISFGYEGDQIIFRIDQTQGLFPVIDYKNIYRNLTDYGNVLEGYISALKAMYRKQSNNLSSSSTFDTNIKAMKGLAEDARQFAAAHNTIMNRAYNAADHKRMHDAFACYSRWVLESSNAIASLVSAYNSTNAECRKICRAVYKVLFEIKAKQKKD